ncbi:MAG TPA: hypothetical protein VMW15_05705 [Terracidiphilus sp.]|jgi:hypothetical protein|nr:hypothetical protein [Terracidiphilus sp.]
MQSPPEFSSTLLQASADCVQQPAQAATLVYQGVTVAAMLLLLCSMWVF